MTVTLLNHTPLSLMTTAGRTAWQSFHLGGVYDTPTDDISDVDINFIDRIVNQHKHGSVAESVVYNFSISGVSRALLQEWSRHRIMSQTVESTRYTLKGKLKHEQPFLTYSCITDGTYELATPDAMERAAKYIHFTGNQQVDLASLVALDNLRDLVEQNVSNDVLKYALPESWLVSLVCTINARSLANFLTLRSSTAALPEIRQLAHAIYQAVPDTHKFLYTHCLTEL